MEVSKRFKGIRNLRNTCFINSVLQALTCIPPLKSFFMKTSPEPEDCLFNQFKNFISNYSEAVDMIEDRELIKSCYSLFPNEIPFTQQDAQEFFCLFIENLAGVLERRKEENIFKTLFGIEVSTTSNCSLDDGENNEICEMSYQLILSICNMKTSVFDSRSEFELDFLSSKKNSCFCSLFGDKNPLTINDCIRNYFSNYQESRSDVCRFCNKANCVEVMGIRRYPKYLFISLKRFEFNKEMVKVNKRVYPLDKIQLGIEKVDYELFAVIEHRQRFGRLHYFAYCKDENFWAKCNDEDVRACNVKSVENSQPYILGYKRMLGDLRESSNEDSSYCDIILRKDCKTEPLSLEILIENNSK